MPVKISEMNERTATQLTTPANAFVEVAISGDTSQSYKMSLDTISKKAGLTTVANVAALFARTDALDNQLFQTLGYTTEGIGEKLYRYDAGSEATIDGGFVQPGIGGTLAFTGTTFNGEEGDGRFIAVDQTKANVMVFGSVGDGITDDTNAIQRALATGKTVYVPSGTYLTSSTMQMAANYQRIYGDGRLSRIVTSISNGSPCLDLNGKIVTSVQDLSVWGATQTSPYQNAIGIEWGGAQHWTVVNVEVRFCATLFKMDDAFIGTGVSMVGKYGGIGCTALELNNVDMSLHLENCSQPLILLNSQGTRIDFMHESPTGITTSSTINGCHGINFSSVYTEYTSGVTVPEFVIGNTANCSAIKMQGLTSAFPVTSGNVPYIDAYDVDGLTVTGRINAQAGRQTVRTSSSTKNIFIEVIDNAKSSSLSSVSSHSSMGPIVNLYDDPFFDLGLPVLTSSPGVAESLDTTTTLPWASSSMKLTIDSDGTFAHAQRVMPISGILNRVLGKTIGLGTWFKAPDNANYVAGSGRCEIRLTSNGTGGTSSSVQNQQWVPGEWTFCFNYLAIPADATTLTIEWWANRSSDALIGEIVYVGGTVIWVGGKDNQIRVANGLFSNESPLVPRYGTGDPNGVIAGAIGQLYVDTAGGASTTLYVKESGAGTNTGWVAK